VVVIRGKPVGESEVSELKLFQYAGAGVALVPNPEPEIVNVLPPFVTVLTAGAEKQTAGINSSVSMYFITV